MNHPTLQGGNTAVITGGASGIGLACAQQFAYQEAFRDFLAGPA
jgi:NAD(P)-dependent dehydrogenase (short-subunit alcohol dehydrogenase family)